MAKTFKLLAGLSLVGFLSACGGAQEEEIVLVDPQPIEADTTFTGKYK